VAADVFDDVRRRVAEGQRFDVVVCDPPAFAKKRADVDRAARGYKDVNRLAMSLVAPGGWLLTCSCSGLVDADLFQKIVFSASVDAHAPFSIVARQGAGADHPVSVDCPEGEYLKGIWLRRLQ
jgi:23S rRNA (cytosine1962-C5)-methyltransferase